MDSGSATMIFYTFGMFVQIYFLCWSGNEVILKVYNFSYVVKCLVQRNVRNKLSKKNYQIKYMTKNLKIC